MVLADASCLGIEREAAPVSESAEGMVIFPDEVMPVPSSYAVALKLQAAAMTGSRSI